MVEMHQCSWKPVLTGEHAIVLISLPSEDAAFLSWTPLVQRDHREVEAVLGLNQVS